MVLSLALFATGSIMSSESCFTSLEPKAVRVTTAIVPLMSKFDQAKQRLMQAAVGSINPEILTVTGKTSKIADAKDMFVSGYKLFSATNRKLIEGINNVDNYMALKNTVKNAPKLAAVNVAMKMLSYPKTTALGLTAAGAYGTYKYVQAKKVIAPSSSEVIERYNQEVAIADAINKKKLTYFGRSQLMLARALQVSKANISTGYKTSKDFVVANPKKSAGIAAGSAALVAGTVYLYKKGYFKNPFAKAVKPAEQAVETKKTTPAVEPVKKSVNNKLVKNLKRKSAPKRKK